ncbi:MULTISPECIES: GspH/FimT family protein [Dyella]|uniref:Type II secretion system protein H n=2 Tax=Dyella TaxID=231454 RepID=A0A4R0YV19_9GAMM|nr:MULTISPECIES: GspH/FimT family protein [Dyella]TBR40096.1 hypothetical protein EYV96_07955 [Dyella terrae]TCI12321.1 hypothetical protein EZM97_02915 [Dyella soli]
MPSPPFRHGYTLVELVLLLSVLSVLAVLATPPLRDMMRHQAIRSTAAALQASLQHARELAIRSRRRVVACPSADGVTCDGKDQWGAGWLVGYARDQTRLEGAPVHVSGPSSRNMTVLGSNGRRSIAFRPRGDADGTNASLLICHRGDASHALVLTVSNPGRIRAFTADPEQRAPCALPNR